MKFEGLARINQLQRMILVNSLLYYRMNESIVPDTTFDQWTRELVKLKNEQPEPFHQSVHFEVFKDFDGNSSCHGLPLHDPLLVGKAQYILKIHRRFRNETI